MASDKQIEANRQNAQHSTGPRTPEGKATSRRNALRHRLTAEELIIDAEEVFDYQVLRTDIADEFLPHTRLEEELVDRLASLLWRLRRVPIVTSTFLEWVAFREAEIYDSKYSLYSNRRYDSDWLMGRHLGLRPDQNPHSEETNKRLKIGRMLDAVLKNDYLGRIDRHEAHLMRQLQKVRDELQKLKDARQLQGVEGGILADGGLSTSGQHPGNRDEHNAHEREEMRRHAEAEQSKAKADIDGEWVLVNGKKEPRIGPP